MVSVCLPAFIAATLMKNSFYSWAGGGVYGTGDHANAGNGDFPSNLTTDGVTLLFHLNILSSFLIPI